MIPVYTPDLSGNEERYVADAVRSSWISSLGPYIDRFEGALREAIGTPHVIVLANGTVALHLALHCLDIGPGDEVIVPTFTYIASVNAIAQTGATPVLADVSPHDWLLDPDDVERLITPRTKAIMPVHLYSGVCDPRLYAIARERGLKVVEDCAEVLGTTVGGRHVGLDGDVSTFSFFGNKTVTTGEGGAVTTSDEGLAARLRKVKGQGQSLTRRYWHDELGFNYRMTNICAAIGTAQMERLDAILARKRQIASMYREALSPAGLEFQQTGADVQSSEWLVTLLLPRGVDRDAIMAGLSARGIDTRPVFYCAHQLPMYRSDRPFPVAEDIAARGISLPSYPALTDEQVRQVSDALLDLLPARN
ncbi:DegT/DnrJ/EryC1/StrS aminotransferase family protein [Sphingomonas sinipercae]|uniref:DegT/DnrJ/EryC1/StrS aminotransferase family protein n=1 Tax=Sphingomonas sinipercae TaxID=2714944 RepID=A0A6G7ZKJ2_9SPHN|nr:DegT/DnrJ/EryC1/StrS aminotransferase family protein [Sphingomonas sinipercae]QIL01453.1 DegT/DnrJ/EryC1/StrS aminotransferase family protein [Sphingomonas sinipercae]